jgi:hypothetical protein
MRGVYAVIDHDKATTDTQGDHMEWDIQPLVPAGPPTVEAPTAETRKTGVRRTVLTAAISALLLVGGGVAVVSAASPAPSSAPSTKSTPPAHGSSANCPNMGGSSGGSSGTSPSTAPAQ